MVVVVVAAAVANSSANNNVVLLLYLLCTIVRSGTIVHVMCSMHSETLILFT